MKKTVLCLLSLVLSFSFLVPGLAEENVLTEYEQEKYDLFLTDIVENADRYGQQISLADDADVPTVEENGGLTTITLTPLKNVQLIFLRNSESLESVTLFLPYESSGADSIQSMAMMVFPSAYSEVERKNVIGQDSLWMKMISNPGTEYEQDGLTFIGELSEGSDVYVKMTVTGDFTSK